MKISFLEPHLKLYGGIRRIIELANRLTKRGHEVTIFHSDGTPCQWMECIARVKRHSDVLKEKHDALVYNDPIWNDFWAVRSASAKIKVFYVLELYERNLLIGFNPRLLFFWNWMNRRLFLIKLSLLSPYLILANATWIKEWLINNLNLSSTLLLGGVNTNMFYPVPAIKNSDEFRILFSGDPRPRKGSGTVLQAIRYAQEQDSRIVFDTYYGKSIPQEKMPEEYSRADIFVDGQLLAGWNNPVAEAMACKTPVVCTDIGAVQDFAFHEKTALLVPPDDAIAMANAILRLLNDQALRETLRENAYQHIQTFDWDTSAAELEKILLAE